MITLASRSPQRAAILTRAGIPFVARPSDVAELGDGDGSAEEVVAENARRKAAAVEGETVLGVDTVVTLDGRIHGKPASAQEAEAVLGALAGRTHRVLSGLCLRRGAQQQQAVAETLVSFRALSPPEIAWYVGLGEWRGRAGGYAVQEAGAALVRRIEGDYLNVVGLPLATLLELWPGLLTGRHLQETLRPGDGVTTRGTQGPTR